MKWSTIAGGHYDEFYNRPECKRENAEIERALAAVVRPWDRVFDFGCGTGLSLRLLEELEALRGGGKAARSMWRGVDSDPAFKGPGSTGDARVEALRASYDVALFLFSAEEIGSHYVQVAIRRCKRYVIVWYHKPYKAIGSWFYHHPFEFLARYFLQSRLIYRILKRDGAKIARLLGEPGYWIAVRS